MSIPVALVGYGLAGAVFHAPLIVAVPELELRVIVTSGRADQAAADFPRASVLPRVDFAGCQLAVIATPNDSHVPLARQALEAGLDVVVDKPLAARAEEGEALIRLAEQRGRILTVFHNRRWDGDFLTVRALLPELGEVHRFESRFERWRPQLKPGWREQADPALAGGVLYDLGSHLVDQALQLFGPVEAVHAEVFQRRAEARVPDDVFLALQHRGGTCSHLWMSALAAAPGPRFRVLGSQAAYRKEHLDVQEEQLKAGLRPGQAGFALEGPERWGELLRGEERQAAPTRPGDYLEFYRAVARAVADRGRPPVDPHEAVEVLRILETAARDGR